MIDAFFIHQTDQVRCVDYDGYGYALYSAYDTSVGIVHALVVDYK